MTRAALRSSLALAVALASAASPKAALAGAGDVGLLAPLSPSAARLESAEVVYRLSDDLGSATLRASFTVANPSSEVLELDLALPFAATARDAVVPNDAGDAGDAVDPERAHDPIDDAVAAAEVDGQPVPVRRVSGEALLSMRLGAFLAGHPDIAAALEDPKAETLPELVAAAGGACPGACAGLRAWNHKPGEGDDGDPERSSASAIERAAREAIPAFVRDFVEPFRGPGAAPAFLLVDLAVAPGAKRTVVIHHAMRAEVRHEVAPNPVSHFGVALEPGRRWSSNGDPGVPLVHVVVDAPPETRLRGPSGPLTQGEFDASADGSGFEVMSNRGLLFGWSTLAPYWRLAVLLVLVAGAGAGAAASSAFPRSPAESSGIARIRDAALVGGPLAAVCSLAALTLLLAFGPLHPLGFAWAARRVVALVFAGLAVGAAAHLAMAGRSASDDARG